MPARRTHALIAAALVALATACSSTSEDEPETVAAAASPTPSPSPSAPAAPYEGTWRAGPAPYSDVVAALEAAGQGQHADAVLQGKAPTSQARYDLKVQGGAVLLSLTVDGEPQGVQDRQSFTASGSELALSPEGSSCAATLAWTAAGDRLEFELVDDTCPDYEGTPDSAIIRGLYASLPFQRVAG